MTEDRLRPHLDVYLGKVEVGVYCVLAVLLLLTALATMVSAGRMLWESLSHAAIAAQTLRVLDKLLGRLDCLNSADAGDKSGTGHPHQARSMVD